MQVRGEVEGGGGGLIDDGGEMRLVITVRWSLLMRWFRRLVGRVASGNEDEGGGYHSVE